MSSTGQAIGMVVGAVVGFFIPGGYVMLGAALGGMLGAAIDPPKGPDTKGPRLEDLTLQTSTYGATKNRAYGTVPIVGNIFWLEGDKYAEHEKKEESGGKGGGGGATATSYSYSATFAVALTEGQQISGVRRLWVGDRLVYDATGTNLESSIASGIGFGYIEDMIDGAEALLSTVSSQPAVNWKLYAGSDTQTPDPRMQADKGVANVSAYPGRAYIVFYDLDLTEHYNNTLMSAQVRVEVVCEGTPSGQVDNVFDKFVGDVSGVVTPLVSIRLTQTGVEYGAWRKLSYDSTPLSLQWGRIEFPYLDEALPAGNTYSPAGGWGYTYRAYFVTQSDADYVLTSQVEYSGYYYPWYRLIGSAGVIDSTGRYLNTQATWESGGNVVFDRGDIYLFGASGKLQKISIAEGVVMTTSAYTYPGWVAASDNYLFIVTNSGTHVRKIARADFSEVADYTMPAAIESLSVLDDDQFYTLASNGTVRKFVSGTEVATLPAAFPTGPNFQFVVASEEPFAGVSTRYYAGTTTWTWSIIHNTLQAAPAKLRDIVTYECGLVGLDAGDLDLTDLTNSDVRGYRLAGVTSPRAALEPLQAAWPFDVFQKGYKIGFKSRGSASVATIPEADLGTVAGGEDAAVLLPVTREMETQIARMVTIKYLDPNRDYEVEEQTSPERPGVSSVAPREIDLPLSMIASEAMHAADVLNMKEWTERVSLGPFTLPPTYLNLVPADVVTINHRSRDWQVRITRIEYLPDGRLTCSAVATASSAYSSTAIGVDPIVLGQSLVPLYGSSRVVLLDIPRIDSAQDAVGVSAVMYGFTAAWPGGILVRSDDSGQTWQTAQGFNAKAKVFTATNAIGAALTNRVDFSSVLTVTPDHDAAALYSITETQLFAEGNLAAYGTDGRWEIIAFRTVVDNTGSYTLTNFMRGRYGTEGAMATHAVGDKVILLDTSVARFVNLSTSALNSLRLWRGLTQGASVASAPDTAFTYAGVNLKPLSPVYLNGWLNQQSSDWNISWTRRSRHIAEPFSGVVTPLGETAELYEIEMWNSSFSTLVRSITGLTAPSYVYALAQQTADFGGMQETLYLKIYQVSSVTGRGYPLQQSITRTVSADPYGYLVSSLLHGNGANGSTTITDQTGKSWTALSGPTIATVAGAYNSTAISFPATSSYIGTPYSNQFDFGIGAFTFECRIKLNSLSGSVCLYSRASGNNYVTRESAFSIYSSTVVSFYYGIRNTNSVVRDFTSPVTLTTGTWYDIEFNRDQYGVMRAFINGNISVTTFTDTTDVSGNFPTYVGAFVYSSAINCVNGYMENIRFTKGVARHTTSYTPGATQFPDP